MRRVFLPRRPFFQVLALPLGLQKQVGRQKKALTNPNNRSTFGTNRHASLCAGAFCTRPFHNKIAFFITVKPEIDTKLVKSWFGDMRQHPLPPLNTFNKAVF